MKMFYNTNKMIKQLCRKNELMTEGNITQQIFLFAVPLIIGNFLQQFYNTVDSIIVGNFIYPIFGTIESLYILYPASWTIGMILMIIYTIKVKWLKPKEALA